MVRALLSHSVEGYVLAIGGSNPAWVINMVANAPAVYVRWNCNLFDPDQYPPQSYIAGLSHVPFPQSKHREQSGRKADTKKRPERMLCSLKSPPAHTDNPVLCSTDASRLLISALVFFWPHSIHTQTENHIFISNLKLILVIFCKYNYFSSSLDSQSPFQ